MKKYRFHWLDGKVEEGEGRDVADAFTHLGYGAGALRVLDWHEEVKTYKKIIPKEEKSNG